MENSNRKIVEPVNRHLKCEDPGTAFLHMCGYRADATPIEEKKERSVRALSTPVGGARRDYGSRFHR